MQLELDHIEKVLRKVEKKEAVSAFDVRMALNYVRKLKIEKPKGSTSLVSSN